jgi:hypothetical protein
MVTDDDNDDECGVPSNGPPTKMCFFLFVFLFFMMFSFLILLGNCSNREVCSVFFSFAVSEVCRLPRIFSFFFAAITRFSFLLMLCCSLSCAPPRMEHHYVSKFFEKLMGRGNDTDVGRTIVILKIQIFKNPRPRGFVISFTIR